MPYDPRPISNGGNRGIDERFSRTAPKGKFRVVAVDTFDGGDWVSGDFNSAAEANAHARKETQGKQMLKMYVYDDTGACVSSYGRF